jgi:lipase ATG15
MEKAPSIHRPNTAHQAPHRQKPRLLVKALLILSLLASVYFLIRGGGASSIACSAPTALRGYWHPDWCSHNQPPLKQPPSQGQDEFRLVSIHRVGLGKHRNQVYQVLDIPADSSIHSLSTLPNHRETYTIPSTTRKSTHLTDRSRENTLNYISHARLSAQALRDDNPLAPVVAPFSAAWTTEDVVAPNISDMNAILTLAKVASNAYIRIPDTEDWYDLGRKWNESTDFGWEENGLRGHVFANTDNSTIIMAMKGTSPPFVGGSDTSTNDKVNVSPSRGLGG